MFYKVGTPKKLSSLNNLARASIKNRRQTRIAVIDDDPFSHHQALVASGFDLIEIGDIKSIESIANYSIIICDIRGVGSIFKSKYEGAHVISEIRSMYPDKYLIAFTGMTFDATYNKMLGKADISASKDFGTEEWTPLLDLAIKEVTDPVCRWLRFRKHLLEMDIEIYEIFELEQAFIESINKRDSTYLNKKSSSINLSKEARDLITTFATSAVVHLIKDILTT